MDGCSNCGRLQANVWELQAQVMRMQAELQATKAELVVAKKRIDPMELFDHLNHILPMFSTYPAYDPLRPSNPNVSRVLKHPAVAGCVYHLGDTQLRVEVKARYIATAEQTLAVQKELAALVPNSQPHNFHLRAVHGERVFEYQ
jgi:outer membrane murein-binding lipoprotein Lpp